jgi:hypothetical protein
MSRIGDVFGFDLYSWPAEPVCNPGPHLEVDMHHRQLLLAGTTIALTAACSRTPEVPTASVQTSPAQTAHAAHGAASRINNGDLTPAQKQAVADVRNATTRFHDIAVAIAPAAQNGGGYTVQFPAGCAASPDGAQGFHYLNERLVDANVELLRPELVMYEPGPNGQMNLVGVDYIVPLALSAEPPTLLGVPFEPLGPPLNVWALHIWAWRPNSSGMFAMWNPKVSCENAQ